MNRKTATTVLITAAVVLMLSDKIKSLPLVNKLPTI